MTATAASAPPLSRLIAAAEKDGRAFYVSVRSGTKHGLLVGPFATNAAAQAWIPAAQAAAEKVDDRAAFYEYGTCSAAGPVSAAKPGKLNAAVGYAAP